MIRKDYDNMSLVHGSDLAVGMRSSYVLHLLLWFHDETRTKLIVVWNLQWIGSSQHREVVFVPLWISCQGHENDRVSVEMAMLMPRQSSWSLCWSPVVSSGGRYPRVLYNFILGNRLQATVVIKAGQKRLHHIPKKASFVSSKQTQLCFKFPKTESGKWHCA